MSINSDTLRRLAELSLAPEQMAGVLGILADIQSAEEDRKRGQRERTKRHREAKRDGNVTVTSAQRDTLPSPKRKVSPCTPSKENNPLPTLDLGASAPTEPAAPAPVDHFEDFWKAYPKREGDNPKKPARQAFEAAVKRGAKPETIIAAAKAYAKRHPVPTQFCKQARFWLSQEYYQDAENAPSKPAYAPKIPETDEQWARTVHLCRLQHQWPAYLGPSPMDEGCKAPDHLLTAKDRREYWRIMQVAS